MCQFDDIDETYVPLPTLDPTDVIPVQVGTIRQLFVAPSALWPKLSQSLPQNGSRIGG